MHRVIPFPRPALSTRGLPTMADLRTGLLESHLSDLNAAFDAYLDAMRLGSFERIEATLERLSHLHRVARAAVGGVT